MTPRSSRLRRALAGWGALLLLAAARAGATGFLAYELRKSCLECHVRFGGGGGLNEKGQEAYARGYRFARDPALTVWPERAPLSPGGRNMLARRYRDLGARLFRMKQVGTTGRSCADCHAPAANLAGAFDAYPRFREDVGRWMSLEDAVNDCLVQRMGTHPLVDGSRSQAALALHLRDLAPRVHPGKGEGERAVAPRPRGGSGDGGHGGDPPAEDMDLGEMPGDLGEDPDAMFGEPGLDEDLDLGGM